MNRYQMYLDSASIRTFDTMASLLGASRSHLLRDVVKRVAREYEKILSVVHTRQIKNNPLLKMAGFAKSTTGHVSENIDEIYLHD